MPARHTDVYIYFCYGEMGVKSLFALHFEQKTRTKLRGNNTPYFQGPQKYMNKIGYQININIFLLHALDSVFIHKSYFTIWTYSSAHCGSTAKKKCSAPTSTTPKQFFPMTSVLLDMA